jgi:hypothetical protein
VPNRASNEHSRSKPEQTQAAEKLDGRHRPPPNCNEPGNAEQTAARVNRVARGGSQSSNKSSSSSTIQRGLDEYEEVWPWTDQSQEKQDDDGQDRMEFVVHQNKFAGNILPLSSGSQEWHN